METNLYLAQAYDINASPLLGSDSQSLIRLKTAQGAIQRAAKRNWDNPNAWEVRVSLVRGSLYANNFAEVGRFTITRK